MKIRHIIALILGLSALIAAVQKFNAYRESVSSRAALEHNIKMLENSLESNGASRVGPHSWAYRDKFTNAVRTNKIDTQK
jgi:hypothetical protein